MKTKNILSLLSLSLVMGLALASCSEEDNITSDVQPAKSVNGLYTYHVEFDGLITGFDEEGTTRAVTKSWSDKASVFGLFTTGSKTYIAYLRRTSNDWELVGSSDFLNLDASGTCELIYMQEGNGDYYSINSNTNKLDVYNNGTFVRSTSTPWDFSSLDVSEQTAMYYAKGTFERNYANSSFSVKGTLEPVFWRMRFNGNNGTTITMPASDNEIVYCSTFKWSVTDGASMLRSAKDVSLTVSNGYTPYVYGEFKNKNSANKITVKNGNDTYTRNFTASNLPVGKSGYFTIPTSSNYSSNGWTKVNTSEPMELKSLLEKPLGKVNVNLKTESYTTIRNAVASAYTISDNTSSSDNLPWFSLYVSSNSSCSNLTYQGLPFDRFNVFENTDGISTLYYFKIKKSDANYNYMAYINKIVQDFKNINISLTSSSSNDDLAHYNGYDSAKNYYSVAVSESGTDSYEFRIYASYKHSTPSSTLFEEPYMGWASSIPNSQAVLKSMGYTIKSESDSYFSCTTKYKESSIFYNYSKERLDYVDIWFDGSKVSVSDVRTYLSSTLKYTYTGTGTNYAGTTYNYNLPDGITTCCVYNSTSDDGSSKTILVYRAKSGSILFGEPYTKWGASKATTRNAVEALGYVFDYEDSYSITFKPKYKEFYNAYQITNSAFDHAYFTIKSDYVNLTEMRTYVSSLLKYTYKGTSTLSDGTTLYKYLTPDGKSQVTVYKSTTYVNVWYDPVPSSAPRSAPRMTVEQKMKADAEQAAKVPMIDISPAAHDHNDFNNWVDKNFKAKLQQME